MTGASAAASKLAFLDWAFLLRDLDAFLPVEGDLALASSSAIAGSSAAAAAALASGAASGAAEGVSTRFPRPRRVLAEAGVTGVDDESSEKRGMGATGVRGARLGERDADRNEARRGDRDWTS